MDLHLFIAPNICHKKSFFRTGMHQGFHFGTYIFWSQNIGILDTETGLSNVSKNRSLFRRTLIYSIFLNDKQENKKFLENL